MHMINIPLNPPSKGDLKDSVDFCCLVLKSLFEGDLGDLSAKELSESLGTNS